MTSQERSNPSLPAGEVIEEPGLEADTSETPPEWLTSAGTPDPPMDSPSIGAKDIGRYGLLVLMLALVGRLFGLFREITFSSYFGTTGAFDAFTIVFSIILFVASLLGVVPFLLIPMLTEALGREDRTEFSKRLTAIMILVLSIVGLFVLGGGLWAERVIRLAAPGLMEDPGLFELAVRLMRLLVPLIGLLAAAQVLRSLLHLSRSFVLPSLESMFFNVGVIALVIVGWNVFGVYSPLSIPYGYYLAYIVFVTLCFWRIRKRFSFKWTPDLVTLKMVWMGIGSLMVAVLLNNLNPLVLFWNASLLPEGAVSALGYVQRLATFAMGTFVNSFLVVFLPLASMAFQEEGVEYLRGETERMLLRFLVFSCYVMVFVSLNSQTLVQLIYQRGSFTESSVQLVSGLLIYYLPWFLCFPVSNVAVRVCYIHKDYNVLVLVSAGGLLLTLVLAPLLRRTLGLNGLGLMSSLHMIVYSSLLVLIVNKRYFPVRLKAIGRKLAPNLGLVALLALGLWLAKAGGVLSPEGLLTATAVALGVPFAWWLNKEVGLTALLKQKVKGRPVGP